MTTVTLTWTEFLKEAEEFLHLSKTLKDDWELLRKDDSEGNTYLSCKKKVLTKLSAKPDCSLNEDAIDFISQCNDSAEVPYNKNEKQVLLMEYHIVYSISYQVPVLYLRVQRNDGSMLEMEEIWGIFGTNKDQHKSRTDMLTVLTQMEHPVLFKPFFAIHPCRTAELLGQTQKSSNSLLTFISLMGPYVKLNLNNQYGLLVGNYADKEKELKSQ